MASRFSARPSRRIAGPSQRHARTAADYVKTYYEQQENEVDEGQEEEESVFSMWKSVAVAVIMIACFASIYPKLLHPFLMYVIGFGDQSNRMQADPETVFKTRHPGGAGQGMHMHPHSQFPGGQPIPGGGDRFASAAAKMAGGRMPGMGQFASADESPGGKGTTWHWLLPFYTIGVVIFLIYTMGKILWRRPQITARHRYNMRYNSTKDRFEANMPGMDVQEESAEDEEEEPPMFLDEEEERENSEAEDHPRDAFSNKQLQNLQSRLQQTESAMKNILVQLDHLSSNADPAEVESVKKSAAATLDKLTNNKQDNLEEEPVQAAVIPHPNPSDEKKRRSAERECKLPPFMDSGEPRYISDLERALTDFQRLSDDYVKQHSTKGNKKKEKTVKEILKLEPSKEEAKPEEKSERDDSDNVVFDTMENDPLTVPPPVGTIIAVGGKQPQEMDSAEEDPKKEDQGQTDNKKNRVRHRKGRQHRMASD